MIHQESLCIECGATTCSRRRYGLTVYWIGAVSCGENAIYISGGAGSRCFYISLLIERDEVFENICIGFVAYGKEESVYVYVKEFLMIGAFVSYKTGASPKRPTVLQRKSISIFSRSLTRLFITSDALR